MNPLSGSVSAIASPLRPSPPAWALTPFIDGAVEHIVGSPGVPLTSRRTEQWTLLSGSIAGATRLAAPELVDSVHRLYRALAEELSRQQRHAVRIWNFVPDIQGRLGDGNRYMAFNVGRYSAYCDWFGGPSSFAAALPTASAVGVDSDALSVHLFAADEPGCPVENPRQTPSYNYSRRYGVRPPCFSRATRLGSTLLIGGTASILGERSQHEDDVDSQARETCRNIAALIRAASPQLGKHAFGALVSLRVHVRDIPHAQPVRALLNELAPDLPAVELVQAALCRPELLVEIEGVADC